MTPAPSPVELAVCAGLLVAFQGITFRSGGARRSAAQPLVFYTAARFWPGAALPLIAATHLLSRAAMLRSEGHPPTPRALAGGALGQLVRAASIAAAVRWAPAHWSAPLLLVGVDLATATAFLLTLRVMKRRRRAEDGPGRALGGELLSDSAGAVAFMAPSLQSVLLLGIVSALVGHSGRLAERQRESARRLEQLGLAELATASGLEEFLEGLGRSLRGLLAAERLELFLLDEAGQGAGRWELHRGEVRSLPLDGPDLPQPELTVDTPDSFAATLLATPGPLPRTLVLPVVEGTRLLASLAITSDDLPRLDEPGRRLLDGLLRQAGATLRALRLQRLATTDPLTGLAIRRLFDLRLSEALAKAHAGRGAALVLVDVDHFKKVNDTHGHPAGDEVLRRVGDRLRRTLRGADLAARIGGEEFALLLSTTAEGARIAAERIRKEVADQPVLLPGGIGLRITASFGVATIDATGTPGSVVSAADRALYRAKSSGRNRVAVASAADFGSTPDSAGIGSAPRFEGAEEPNAGLDRGGKSVG